MIKKRKARDTAIDVTMVKKVKTQKRVDEMKQILDQEKDLVMSYMYKTQKKKKSEAETKATKALFSKYVTVLEGDEGTVGTCTCGHTFTKHGYNELNLCRHLKQG